MGGRRLSAGKVQMETNRSPAVFGKCIASVRFERTAAAKRSGRRLRCAPKLFAKGMPYGIQRSRLYSESHRPEPDLLPRIEMRYLRFFDSEPLN
jgi:hypothetical protein